jgi:hypothetical protein
LPLIILAAAIGYAAFWWGLDDRTGDLVMLVAVLLGALGLALAGIGFMALTVLIDGWAKTHLRLRPRKKKVRQAAPPPPIPAREPPGNAPSQGPRIF